MHSFWKLFSKQQAFAWFLILTLCVGSFGQAAAAPAASPLSPTENRIAEGITIATIKEATAALAADDMLGRGTMQPGG
jgi:hypothetical protein